MKNIIPVIFFISIIFCFIIYKYTDNNKKKIVFIGENSIANEQFINNFKKYDFKTFTYDNITYKELYNSIRQNDYYVSKNKKIYLNRLIYNSDYIILFGNNVEYNKKCNKEQNILNNYNKTINNNLDKLINLISKIKNSKIILVGNYCENKNIISNYNNESIIFVEYSKEKLIDNINKVLTK